MKQLTISILFIFTMTVHAQTPQEKLVKDGKCIPRRDLNGNISSYLCDQKEIEKLKSGNFEQLDVRKTEVLHVDSSVKSKKNSNFKLNSSEEGSVYEQLGLKQGDQIVSYDGKLINSVSDSLEMYEKLRKNQVKEIVISREGKRQILSF